MADIVIFLYLENNMLLLLLMYTRVTSFWRFLVNLLLFVRDIVILFLSLSLHVIWKIKFYKFHFQFNNLIIINSFLNQL